MSDDLNVLDYRLQAIENELKSLKELLVTVPVLTKDFENLEHRVDNCEINVDLINKEIAKLKAEPIKKSAEKWKYISDYIFKSIVAIIIGYFLYKVGLQ